MKKTITILLLAVFVAFSFTACGGGGGGGGISDIINKVTGNTNDKASKDNFAGKRFGCDAWSTSGATNFEFGAAGTGTVTVTLAGQSKGACTYNKPTGLSNVNLVIKDSSNNEIFNRTVNFDNEAHSFNCQNEANNLTVPFSLY